MRVQELAELAGTTTRTIRYYHQIGLLPIPPTAAGRRDYQIAHLARLLRIRWLADTGLPLSRIGELLGPAELDASSAHQDLTAALAEIDARIAALQRQRDHVQALIGRNERGDGVDPLSGGLQAVLDAIKRAMPDERHHRLVEHERDLIAALAALGLIPDNAHRLEREFDAEHRDWAARMLIGLDELAHTSAVDAPAAIGALCELTWTFLDQRRPLIESMVSELARGPERAAVWARLGRLFEITYPHPQQREFVRRMVAEVRAHPVLGPTVG